MPKVENKMCFMVNSSEITNRFDPFYYYQSFVDQNSNIKLSGYKSISISDIAKDIQNGLTPSKDSYIELEDLNLMGNESNPIVKAGSHNGKLIDLSKCDFVKSKFKGKYVHKNDIFILSAAHQAEYVGKNVYYLDEEPELPTLYVGELIKISTNIEICNPYYLFSLLNSNFYKVLMNREKRGQTSHIYPEDIKQIIIPLPPLEIQNQIAEEVKYRMEAAKQLQKDAVDTLESAKQKVEQLIFEV